MIKNNVVNKFNLSLLIAIMLFGFVMGCGKKEGTTEKTDGKTDSRTDTKTSSSDDVSADKPFKVEFEIKGNDKMKGTLTGIYFKDRCKTTSHMNTAGMEMEASAYVPNDGFVYIVSSVAGMKKGIKYDRKKFADESGKKEDNVDISTWKDKLNEMNKVGEEEILGKKCTIYEAKDKKYKISVYKETIPLKFYMGDKMTMEATKLETDIKVDDTTFTPPSDITYSDGSDMLNGMKNMKDPKNIEGMKDKMKEMEDAMKKYNK